MRRWDADGVPWPVVAVIYLVLILFSIGVLVSAWRGAVWLFTR